MTLSYLRLENISKLRREWELCHQFFALLNLVYIGFLTTKNHSKLLRSLQTAEKSCFRRVFNCEPQTTQRFRVLWREGKQLILVKKIFKQPKFICHIGLSKNRGGFYPPQNGWFIWENPMNKWMIWGYPHFWKHPYRINGTGIFT